MPPRHAGGERLGAALGDGARGVRATAARYPFAIECSVGPPLHLLSF
eukprot:SAG11_NODE_36933_length_259_cov_0.650000_1_plen_46_part_10